ncbi:MAG: redox-regulated ATPase YchF [Candidatus Sungbacteria bacterium]|uniref:Redox-regulated ATPase YchF n=1 Tax=Candidatus Sungiibacteriota bacterium TaxID=2750080 RepID=A0A9D6LPK8_9BACT|nr:redox-regulated ATPase YchF [Candidatus Sungbacteria bacterium]
MGLKIGIIGLPNVGKSTLFHALTKQEVLIANYPFATIDPNVGVVTVRDERLLKLARFSHSKKVIPAAIEFVDIAGLVGGASEGAGLGNAFLSHIREVDALCQVVRVFQNSDIIHVAETPDALRDFEIINLELVLKDLETTMKLQEKIGSEARSGDKKKIEESEDLKRIKHILEAGRLLSQANLSDAEGKIAGTYNLLTIKPMLVIFNISDKEVSEIWQPGEDLMKRLGDIPYLSIPIGIESEAATMEEVQANEFRSLVGISSSSLDLVTRAAYGRLGLITFFTTGEDETRAWTIEKDAKAPRAGRAIHSDFEDKFIRAEVIPWDALLRSGSWAGAKEHGRIRIEGKEYTVKDGDVIEFRI